MNTHSEHDALFSEASDDNSANEESQEQQQQLSQAQEDEVTKVLQTPWEQVYQLSEDGTTYVRPSFMRGVPVQRMPDTYHEHGWASLEAYLAEEQVQEKLKAEYSALPDHKHTTETRKRAKLHKDNVSKHRKIREVFGGESTRHPNQVIAKVHLPDGGLCEQEVMYMLGCKYSDLADLRIRGQLVMDPWDFLRWRIGRLVMERTRIPGRSGKEHVRGVIFTISSEKSDDPVFREIILRSAKLSGRAGRYGRKNKNAVLKTPSELGMLLPASASTRRWRSQATQRRHSADMSNDAREANQQQANQQHVPRMIADREARRARIRAAEEARRAQEGGGYQGVNAFRNQQRQAGTRPVMNGGPYGG